MTPREQAAIQHAIDTLDQTAGTFVWEDPKRQRMMDSLSLLRALGDGWEEISTAPKDGTPIVGWFVDVDAPLIARYSPGDEYSDYVLEWDRTPLSDNPTHWQPLPVPPEGKQV